MMSHTGLDHASSHNQGLSANINTGAIRALAAPKHLGFLCEYNCVHMQVHKHTSVRGRNGGLASKTGGACTGYPENIALTSVGVNNILVAPI
jgi:hypothetical protein